MVTLAYSVLNMGHIIVKNIGFKATIITIILMATGSSAAPFGFDMQAPPNDSFCKETESKTYYECSSAPKPHSEFERYIVQYDQAVGWCLIKGIGVDHNDNSFGTKIKSSVKEITGQITSKYGAPKTSVDRVRNGSIWDEPEDYMTSLVKNERLAFNLWELDPVIDGIEQIFVGPKALSRGKAYLIVEFHTPATDACDDVKSDSDAGSF